MLYVYIHNIAVNLHFADFLLCSFLIMQTSHFFLFLSFFNFFFSHANHSCKSDHSVYHAFNFNSSLAIFLNSESWFSIMPCRHTLSTHINSYASFKLSTVIHSLFKCNSFCLSESTIRYYFFLAL